MKMNVLRTTLTEETYTYYILNSAGAFTHYVS